MAVSIPMDFSRAADEGYARGRQRAQDQVVRNAFLQPGGDPIATQRQLLAAGAPEAAQNYGTLDMQQRQRTARDTAIKQFDAGDSRGAQRTYLQEGMTPEAQAVAKMDEAQLAQAKQKADKFGALAYHFEQIPEAERLIAWQQYAPIMVQQGLITAEQAANPRLDTPFLKSIQAEALGLNQLMIREDARRKATVEAQNTEADNTRAEAALEESRRHNREMERLGGVRAETGRITATRPRASGGGATKPPAGFILD